MTTSCPAAARNARSCMLTVNDAFVDILSVGEHLRCLGERGFALLNQRWRTLQHITASPSKITEIARAALVLTQYEHGYIR